MGKGFHWARDELVLEMAGCTPPGAPLCPEACRPRPLAPMLSLPGCPCLRKASVLTQLPDFLFLGGGRPWVLLTFCVSFTMINSSVSTLYWLQMPQILPLWPVCPFSMVFERAEPPSSGSLIPVGLRKPIPTGQCPTSCRALSLRVPGRSPHTPVQTGPLQPGGGEGCWPWHQACELSGRLQQGTEVAWGWGQCHHMGRELEMAACVGTEDVPPAHT